MSEGNRDCLDHQSALQVSSVPKADELDVGQRDRINRDVEHGKAFAVHGPLHLPSALHRTVRCAT
jgi:hypothetical protein